MTEVKGYKAYILNDGKLKDNFNNIYEVGKQYHCDGEIVFNKRGFHLCTYPEDTLRYVDGFNENIVISEVTGFGNIHKYDDEYNDYFDMYSVSDLKIESIIPKMDLIDLVLEKSPYPGIERLFGGIKLTDNEIEYIIDYLKSNNRIWLTDMNLIDYYIKNVQHKKGVQRTRK